MQILKEEVKEAIVQAAIDEFYLNGFQKASMRTIAQKSEVTVGNLYRYFKNKNELFNHIVKPAYLDLINHIHHHNDEDDLINIEQMDIVKQIEERGDLFTSILIKKQKIFLILFNQSEGTDYENIKEEIIENLAQHFEFHFNFHHSNEDKQNFKMIGQVFAASLLEGLFYILRTQNDPETIYQLVRKYLYLLIYGFIKILKK